jgi:hypothetical protein
MRLVKLCSTAAAARKLCKLLILRIFHPSTEILDETLQCDSSLSQPMRVPAHLYRPWHCVYYFRETATVQGKQRAKKISLATKDRAGRLRALRDLRARSEGLGVPAQPSPNPLTNGVAARSTNADQSLRPVLPERPKMFQANVDIGKCHGPFAPLLHRLPEAKHEPVRLAANGGIEDLHGVVVVGIGEHRDLAVEHESGTFHLGLHCGGIDAVQVLGVLQSRPRCAGMVGDHVISTRFQKLEDRLVEGIHVGTVHKTVVKIVVVFERPDDIDRVIARGSRLLAERIGVRFHIAMPGFRRNGLRHGDRIGFEAGDLGRNIGMDLAVRTHNRGKDAGPVTTARPYIDDHVARLHFGKRQQFRRVARHVLQAVLPGTGGVGNGCDDAGRRRLRHDRRRQQHRDGRHGKQYGFQ